MESDNKEKRYCDDDGEYRIHCHICDKLAIFRYYKKHLNSRTQRKNFRKSQQLLNNTKIQLHQKKSLNELLLHIMW